MLFDSISGAFVWLAVSFTCHSDERQLCQSGMRECRPAFCGYSGQPRWKAFWQLVYHQGPAVETATTVMVVGHVSRPDVEAVHRRRLCFPDRRCTNLEHSVAGRSIIQFFIYIQASAEYWAFIAKLSWLNSWIFVTFVRWLRSFGLCHPNLICSIYLLFIYLWRCTRLPGCICLRDDRYCVRWASV